MARAGNGLRTHLLQAMVQQKLGGNLGGGRGRFHGNLLQQLGQGVPAKDRLAQLIQRIQSQPEQGGTAQPGSEFPNGLTHPGIHAFGPGGSVNVPNQPQRRVDPGAPGLPNFPLRRVDPGAPGLPHPQGSPFHPVRQSDAIGNALGEGPHSTPMQLISGGAGDEPRSRDDITHAPGYAQATHNPQLWMERHPGAMGGNGAIPNWVLEGLTNAAHQGGIHPDAIQTILQHLSQSVSGAQGAQAQAPQPPAHGGPTPY